MDVPLAAVIEVRKVVEMMVVLMIQGIMMQVGNRTAHGTLVGLMEVHLGRCTDDGTQAIGLRDGKDGVTGIGNRPVLRRPKIINGACVKTSTRSIHLVYVCPV